MTEVVSDLVPTVALADLLAMSYIYLVNLDYPCFKNIGGMKLEVGDIFVKIGVLVVLGEFMGLEVPVANLGLESEVGDSYLGCVGSAEETAVAVVPKR